MPKASHPLIPHGSTWVLIKGKGRGTHYEVVASTRDTGNEGPINLVLQCPTDRRRTRRLLADAMLSSGLYKRVLPKPQRNAR